MNNPRYVVETKEKIMIQAICVWDTVGGLGGLGGAGITTIYGTCTRETKGMTSSLIQISMIVGDLNFSY